MTSSINDLESVTGTAVIAQTGTDLGSTFSIGTETVTGTAAVDVTTAGQITFSIGDETAFGEAFQNLSRDLKTRDRVHGYAWLAAHG